jgi:hypothetical protein
VVEHLPSECEAVSSNPSTTKNNKTNLKKKGKILQPGIESNFFNKKGASTKTCGHHT